MEKHLEDSQNRVIYLDIVRVLACFMVVMVHSGEFFYIGAGGTVIRDNATWVAIYGSFLRISVPLFVMISGFLLLPVKIEAPLFYKKRFTRVLIPFLIWSALYAIVPYFLGVYNSSVMWKNLMLIPVNFSDQCGHLWYVYMIIGLYLFIPIISPWIQNATKKAEITFLSIWGFTLFFHYIKTIFPEFWGAAYWNDTPTAYYFTGFIGYLVLGHFMKVHVQLSKCKAFFIGLPLIIVGYLITYLSFSYNMVVSKDLSSLEIPWRFTSINVAMMTCGLFLIFKNRTIVNDRFKRILIDISNLSFGMYLAHIFILNQMYNLLNSHFSTPMLTIPVLAISTFTITYLLIKVLSFLPKSKFIVG